MSHQRARTVVSAILPYNPGVPPVDAQRLRAQLLDARPPKTEIVPGAGTEYGVPMDWATKLYEYWVNNFSLEKSMKRIQSWPHLTTHIEELSIHFVHVKSKKPGAIPLLLVHGWPGSFWEFSEVIDMLVEGEAGKEDALAFDVVVPSLPGFCFSSAPQRRGWTMKDTARVFHKLMGRLGYENYAVQAGDWGQFVARELGAKYSEACKVVHLNWCPGKLPEDVDLTDREKKVQAKGEDWRTNHIGYAVLMRTRPHTLGWMLQDNPLGLLAFIGEKYFEAASPSISSTPSWFDHILTTVCLYYFTRCITTSALPYFENAKHEQFAAEVVEEENFIKAPLGYTSFWYDTAPNSKRAVEKTGNLVWYKERDYAGHFAALEDPRGVVEDVREVVGKFWS